ncbi:HAD family hydrolase [Candidatus Bathyarchaeota archaeon]|nr:HAD family hydrolase [Candidatus Bathyarchaeota archaeon]
MPPTKRFKAVIFDLDGTLIQSKIDYGEMRKRVIEIISETGVSTESLSQTRMIWEIIQGSDRALDEVGIRREARETILRRINDVLNEIELRSLDTVEPTRNAEETLKALRSAGLKIGIATRGCKEYALRSLEKTGLGSYVDAILARDEVEHPKPDPRHLIDVAEALKCPINRVVYVGDTTTDLSTAQAAGVAFVGFLRKDEWGMRLREAGCRVIIEDLLELIDLVKDGID